MSLKTKLSWAKYLPFLILPLLAIALIISQHQPANNLPVNHIQIKTDVSPMGPKVLPEQRRAFVLKFKDKETIRFKDAILTTTGDFHTTFSIEAKYINGAMVQSMIANVMPLSELRKIGFKHLVMSNGREVWDVELRN